MYQTKKTYVKPDLEMSGLIFENPSFLLMLDHFGIDCTVHHHNVNEICRDNNINIHLFVLIANLYNGFGAKNPESLSEKDVKHIIQFLKSSHEYYLNEIIPEIETYIKTLYETNNSIEVKLIDQFFLEYSKEVKEHLDYEDEIAFPYFYTLLEKEDIRKKDQAAFSVAEYREHHTDIESKLSDLKMLLLKHLSISDGKHIKRKILFSLFELEHDLNIHSVIEEFVLMPLINKIEQDLTFG